MSNTDQNTPKTTVPEWLLESERYEPARDSSRFISKTMADISGLLAQFRLDDGREKEHAPSAPFKFLFGLLTILLVSFSQNFLFVLIVLAGVMVRVATMPLGALKRTVAVSCIAFLMTFLTMLPAILLGQNHSAVLVGTKVLISVGIMMSITLTTSYNHLTAGLRAFHVPGIFIMTLDLTLKNIVGLGKTALEVLTSLQLRSVGKDAKKRDSLGNVAGVVFLKTAQASQETYDAMQCRGFDGTYATSSQSPWRKIDLAWALLAVALVILFVYLEGLM